MIQRLFFKIISENVTRLKAFYVTLLDMNVHLDSNWFVVDDIDVVYQPALNFSAEIIEPPRHMFYGQERLLLRDTDGMMIDVSSPSGSPLA